MNHVAHHRADQNLTCPRLVGDSTENSVSIPCTSQHQESEQIAIVRCARKMSSNFLNHSFCVEKHACIFAPTRSLECTPARGKRRAALRKINRAALAQRQANVARCRIGS
jgi:hypothetical protein